MSTLFSLCALRSATFGRWLTKTYSSIDLEVRILVENVEFSFNSGDDAVVFRGTTSLGDKTLVRVPVSCLSSLIMLGSARYHSSFDDSLVTFNLSFIVFE